MAVEPIKEVIKKWENEQISPEQTTGKILVWLEKIIRQQAKIETRLLRLENWQKSIQK